MPGILAVCRINLLKLVIENFSGLGVVFYLTPCVPLSFQGEGEK